MGKKKSQSTPRVQQSMGQMVSKAAISQMAPSIEAYVQQAMRDLGSQLAVQQASTLETLFARVVVLEELLMEKYNMTVEDLTKKVAQVEDRKEGFSEVSSVEAGDMVRLEVSTRTTDQTEYQGTSRVKIYEIGTGSTLGKELEQKIIGMTAGEVREILFGAELDLMVKISINRISRRINKTEVTNEASITG